MEPPHINIIVVYPVEFIGDPVLEENIPKMLSVVREYIKEYESYLTFKTKIENTVWDSECKFCSNGTPILKLAVHPF